MDQIVATALADHENFDYALDITPPMAAISAGRIAYVPIEVDAKMLVRAVNCYDRHIELLEDLQRVLGAMGPDHHPHVLARLAEVRGGVDAVLYQHRQYEATK